VVIRLNHLIIHLFAAAMNRFAQKGQIPALERTITTLIRYLENKPDDLYTVLCRFATDSRWVLRYVAAREIGRFLSESSKEVLQLWLQLADDKRLYVREGTAKGMVMAAESNFDRVWKFCMDAVNHSSDKVRQTAAMPLITWLKEPDLRERLQPMVRQIRNDSSAKVKTVFENYIAPLLDEEELPPAQKKEYATTAELPLSNKLIDQVVGQNEAVAVIRLAARQKRSVLLIGEPGTGKSMLGQAMAELLPASALEDVIVEAGQRESNVPTVQVLPAGAGKQILEERGREFRASVTAFRWILGFTSAVSLFVALFYAFTRDNPSYVIGGLFIVALIFWFAKSLKTKPSEKIPKYLVNNTGKTQAPFIDGTGLHAGALLGDVRHDPYQSGGLESSPHHLVEPGAIHLAHKGILFIDEVSTLSLESQQALLTAFQEKKMVITGRSPGSSGAMIRTEAVPSDFIMVLAGNLLDVEKIHPALRSRIRGYGYEIYMNETMADTGENRYKLSQFVAQEVRKDGKIPHFTRKAVDLVIERARHMVDHPGHLTSRFRELGGLIRAAGDLAVQSNSVLVHAEHVRKALHISQPLEEQMFFREREHQKLFQVDDYPGKVKTFSLYKNSLGQVVRIWTDVQPLENIEVHISDPWARRLDILPVEAALHRYRMSGKYYFEMEGTDLHHQHADFALAMALSAWSAEQGVVIPENIAVCGVLNVTGLIRETPLFERKIEAAKHSGIRTIIAPVANRNDTILSDLIHSNVDIIWVETLDEVLLIFHNNDRITNRNGCHSF
jgi:Lon-like ATP-dependent protease